MHSSIDAALVERGRRLLNAEEGRSWEWSDLVLEVMPRGSDRDRLEDWADAIGWTETGRTVTTLLSYRGVATAWPPEKRCAGASFTAHAELASFADRFDVIRAGMTKRQARVASGKKPEISTAEARPEVVSNLLRDPVVLAQIAADPEAAMSVMRASANLSRQIADRSEADRADAHPDAHRALSWNKALGRLDVARREIVAAVTEAMALERAGDEHHPHREELVRRVDDLARRLDLAQSWLNDGPSRALEDELADLVEGMDL